MMMTTTKTAVVVVVEVSRTTLHTATERRNTRYQAVCILHNKISHAEHRYEVRYISNKDTVSQTRAHWLTGSVTAIKP